WRRELEAQLPGAVGFSPANVREGLARGLEGWTGAALRDLVQCELGGAERLDASGPAAVSGFATTAVLLAGSIPMPTLLALLAPLALRSPVLAKAAVRDPVTAPLVARSVAAADPGLGRCIDVVDVRRDDTKCLQVLLEAACVVVSGSDDAVQSVAARVRAPQRFVAYGHRFSVAALGEEALSGQALESAARGLACDVALWDQLGCLSPVAVFAVGGDAAAPDRLARALAEALRDAEARWPRGSVEDRAAALWAHERAAAELRQAAGQGVGVYAGEAGEWTVVREVDAELRPAPLHRFVRVHPLADVRALIAALAPYGAHLAALAVDGFGRETAALGRALFELGASRLCPCGALQSPPLGWQRDGRGVLAPLARFAASEL
ncbi:MAG TPA: acyl-CoA reductase, partial [Myxococcota bacterium]